MVATTGKMMARWWGNLVLDLDGAKFRQKVGLLLDHQTDQRLGFSVEVKRTGRGPSPSSESATLFLPRSPAPLHASPTIRLPALAGNITRSADSIMTMPATVRPSAARRG